MDLWSILVSLLMSSIGHLSVRRGLSDVGIVGILWFALIGLLLVWCKLLLFLDTLLIFGNWFVNFLFGCLRVPKNEFGKPGVAVRIA